MSPGLNREATTTGTPMFDRLRNPHWALVWVSRVEHYAEILGGDPAVDWFEGAHRELPRSRRQAAIQPHALRERFPVALHGVSLSIGSTAPLDLEYLHR